MAILIKDIEKLFVKESGSVVIYYTKPYKDKEYTNTVYPVDTEGFVAALQQVNEEMTILREIRKWIESLNLRSAGGIIY